MGQLTAGSTAMLCSTCTLVRPQQAAQPEGTHSVQQQTVSLPVVPGVPGLPEGPEAPGTPGAPAGPGTPEGPGAVAMGLGTVPCRQQLLSGSAGQHVT